MASGAVGGLAVRSSTQGDWSTGGGCASLQETWKGDQMTKKHPGRDLEAPGGVVGGELAGRDFEQCNLY